MPVLSELQKVWAFATFTKIRKNGSNNKILFIIYFSFDLLYRGIEITTGGMREENPEKRASQMKEKGLNPKDFDHLRFFRYGMPFHGGLAIGIERLVSQILGLPNVRDACLTPRDPVRLTP